MKSKEFGPALPLDSPVIHYVILTSDEIHEHWWIKNFPEGDAPTYYLTKFFVKTA